MESSSSPERLGFEAWTPSTPARRFRLRGKVGGRERTYLLTGGANLIGRAASSDVKLRAKGVSLRHARLIVGPVGVNLEDLESKNGSFVNGSRVTGTRLSPGDSLWIGSAELTLEQIDERDLRLAVDLVSSQPGPPSETDGPSTAGATPTHRRWLGARLVDRWLTAVYALAFQLEQEGLHRALADASALVGARAAAVLEIDGGEGVVLAACGEIEGSLATQLRAWVAAAKKRPTGVYFLSSAERGKEPLSVAATAAGAGRPLALVLSGDFRARTESEVLLTTMLRLVQQGRVASAQLAETGTDGTTQRRHENSLTFPPGYVPGVSPAIRELHAEMAPFARSDLPVLVSGETGAGKEWVARILHLSSDRRHGPLVAINCAAVPAELLEPELFGIGKGVATGVSPRRGRFLEAQGGTLFLDEIGDLPEVLQPKLLRALEAQEVHPVGEAPVPIDVRIVAATNTDLPQRLRQGRFRADLYYRLAGVNLTIPPLRNRRDDIPMLVEHYLRQISEEIGKPIRGITVHALERLVDHPWPGNVRELVHEVRRLSYLCPEGAAVEAALLSDSIRRGGSIVVGGPAEARTDSAAEEARWLSLEGWLSGAESLDLKALECAALAEALRRTKGNRAHTARLLGLSRTAVRRRIERCRERDGREEKESARDPS